METGTTKYALRLPTPLYERLQEVAEREKRSVNAQIVYLVARAIEEQENRVGEQKATS